MKKLYAFTLLSLSLAATAAPCAAAPAAPVAHAYQMGSTDTKWGFIQFPVNDIDALKIDKTTSSSTDQIGAGEYVDGKYYTYTLVYDFVFGEGLEPSQYVVWNPTTFTQISASEPEMKGRVVDMAYDYTHNTMYALVEQNRTSNGAIGLTALNVIDLATGEATVVGLPGDIRAINGNGVNVEEHLVALASSPADGTLYAMGEYRQLYTLDRTSGLATPVGKRNRIAITNDFQSMAFDAQGNLYQAQMHPDYEYFMQINPATGELTNPVTGEAVTVNSDFTNNAARFKYDPQLTGLYFEGKTFISNVPAAVTGLKAVTGENEPNKVTLTWTLPDKNHDGTAATLTGVEVYRFGTAAPIATLPATAVTYVDTQAPNGDVTYYIQPLCATGAGFPAWTSVFAGADQLNPVSSLKAELTGNTAHISWTAPTSTVNGGYADYANITYNISQVKGSGTTVIATNVAATSYDAPLADNGTYTFVVVPVSCGIEGRPATSNEVTLQGVEQLPYACGFEDNDGGTLWTIINNQSSSTYGWSIISGYVYQQLSGKFAQFKTGASATIPANDWFISPAIHCPAGQYELSFYANGGSFDKHTYKVFIGSDSKEPADFTQEVYSLTDKMVYDADATDTKNYVPVKATFTIAADGDYRIGFQGIGSSTFATLKIDNVSLKAAGAAGIADAVAADVEFEWDPASRTLSCGTASRIEVYSLSGMLIASGASEAKVDATGTVIAKAIIPAGVAVRKLNLK